MENKNNINNEILVYENLDYDIENRINLFKKLLNSLDESDYTLKNLGYEIIDSKILLDLIKSCFREKEKSNIQLNLIDILSREVNRYSEFEKYLRNKRYYVSYDIDFLFDNNIISCVKLNNNNNSKACLNDFINETDIFRLIAKSKTLNLNKKYDILSNNKIKNINFNIKEIFKELLNVMMDDQHYEELNEIINLRKKISTEIITIDACNVILNLDIEKLVLRDDVKKLFRFLVEECSNNIKNSEEHLNKNIEKMQELIKRYKSKKMDKEDEDTYNIYSDIEVSDDEKNIIDYYYEIYKNSIDIEKTNCISFLTFLKIFCPKEKEIINIVKKLTEQFNTIYSEYLIYKTPYINTNLCITFEQYAKMKYGINKVSIGFSKK